MDTSFPDLSATRKGCLPGARYPGALGAVVCGDLPTGPSKDVGYPSFGKDIEDILLYLRPSEHAVQQATGTQTTCTPETSCQGFDEPRAEAEIWNDSRKLPSDRLVRALAPTCPAQALDAVRDFLEQVVPCEIEVRRPWSIRATVFVDFVPLALEFHVFADASGSASVIQFWQVSVNDVVRFASLIEKAITFFRCQGISIDGPPHLGALAAFDDYDDFEDDSFDLEDDSGETAAKDIWADRVKAVADDLRRGGAAVRQECWTTLARWSQDSPDCRSILADALTCKGKGQDLMTQAFMHSRVDSVSEMYPVAVAVRFALSSSHSMVLADSLSLVLQQVSDKLPRLVEQLLRSALRSDPVGVGHGGAPTL